MARFAALLREHGSTVRNIAFYAERLALTPNHLSAVVRQQSGLSVVDWLNRTTVTEAKLLLKHSNLMIYEISDRLQFPEPTAFNRYFKSRVGVTPLEYREGK
ncbi:MAG: helix-turn-helix transcriptional regulator [Prevotella sp.]|nr:helix-turn-helix transcriptional regulator [Prevotella sp.]